MKRSLLILMMIGGALGAAPSLHLPKAADAMITSIDKRYATGERGHLFTLYPTLKQIQVPDDVMLTDLKADGKELWLIGHDALILHLTAEGFWEEQFKDASLEVPLMSLAKVDDQLIAVGGFGLILTSSDRGKHWKKSSLEDEPHLYMVKPMGEHFIACGEFGTVVKISATGELLETIAVPTERTLFGIEVIGDGTWIAYGLQGDLIFASGGEVKKIENPSSSHLYNSLMLEDRLLLFGADGTLLEYKDHKITDRSIDERIGLLCASKDADKIIIGTTKGIRTITP